MYVSTCENSPSALTAEFRNFIIGKLRWLGFKATVDGKISELSYKRVDDSDQPGISERATFSYAGKRYSAIMDHFRYSEFRQID